jgi:hypothetical protein
MVHYLEIADRLRGKLRAAASAVLVIIVHAVEIYGVTPRSQTAEAEAAARLQACPLCERQVRRSHLWSQQHKSHIVSTGDRRLLHAITIDVDDRGRLGINVARRGLR